MLDNMEPIAFKDLNDELQAMIATPTAIINHADGEDLTVRKEVLKFADRHKPIFANVYKGYVIIRRKYGDALIEGALQEDCVLNQNMIDEVDTIYEIRYDFNLRGNVINLPQGSVLVFNGGRLRNGKVKINGNVIYSLCEDWTTLMTPTDDSIYYIGQLRYTKDGYEVYGTEGWFNPYISLRSELVEHISDFTETVNEINTDMATGFKELHDIINKEVAARTSNDIYLGERIDGYIKLSEEDDAKLRDDLDALAIKQDRDNIVLVNAVNARLKDHNELASDVYNGFTEFEVKINKLRDDLTKDIVQSVLAEHNDRVKNVATEVQRIFEYIENREEVFKGILKVYRTDIDNCTRHVDTISDRVNKALDEYRSIIEAQQMSIINNQNRIDVLRDRIVELEGNASKYHVMFVMADSKKVINAQYVIAGQPAIAPNIPEGAKFDKSFAAIYEDTVINITV